MLKRSSRIALATTVAMATGTCLVSLAHGAPEAMSAKATNTMVANATLLSLPDVEIYRVDVKVSGQITSPSHKLGPRRCRASRDIHVTYPRVDGSVGAFDTYPTGKGGRFEATTSLQYGDDIPESGGVATFSLSSPKTTVGKDKLGFRSFTCRALSLTAQLQFPPHPTFGS